MSFSPNEAETLRLAVETFVQPAQQQHSLHSSEIAEKIITLLDGKSPEEQSDFKQLIGLLSGPFLSFTWGGPFQSIAGLSPEQRTELFRSWSTSRFALLRKGYQALKKLSTFIAYSLTDASGASITESITGYTGAPAVEHPVHASAIPLIAPDSVIHCEVLIIGSGAGGGVAAARFAAAGKDVLVIEKGPYLPESAMTNLEADMVSQLYEEHGSLSSVDGSMTVFAGACLGGGTTINWQACFKTPDYVLEEWAESSGISDFTGPAFQKSLERVWQRIGAGREAILHNRNNQLLIQGSQALGQLVKDIPKNSSHCNSDGTHSCGWCGLGCKRGSKQGTVKTFLQDAIDQGARILDRTYIHRLLFSGDAVTGAEGVYTSAEGQAIPVKIVARKVIVSAGSIHSPALLMRSGIAHPELGKNLYLHPVVPVSAHYAEPVESWSGAMMTSTNDEYIRLKGRYGYKIETPPPHPGLLALGMPWNSASDFQERMRQIRHMGVFIVLNRDEHGGEIRLSKDGRPQIHYTLHPSDKANVLHGMKNAARIHAAAGALEIALPHVKPTYIKAAEVQNEQTFSALVEQLRWETGDFTLFSAHQMGTCRMGTSYENAVVTPEGRVWGKRGLYVMDASVFPRCSGVNPMVTILALADYLCSKQLGE